MSISALLLVVLAALIHATWNLLAKRAASVGPAFVFAYNLVSVIVYAPWVIWLLLTRETIWSAAGIAGMVFSGLVHLAYSLCLQRGYQKADLSVVYPVARGTGPTLATLGAILVLGELPTAAMFAGLALVVAGIGLIATNGDLRAFSRPGGQDGVRWGGATGGLIATYTVSDAYVVTVLGVAPVVLDWFSNLLRFFLLLPMMIASPETARTAMRGVWPLAIAVGVLSPLSYILVLAALTMGAPLTVVAPVREMSMMAGALMGMLILREPLRLWRLVGCAVLIAGVILLTTGG